MGKYRLDYFSKYYFYEEDKFSQEVEEGDYILEQIKKSNRFDYKGSLGTLKSVIEKLDLTIRDIHLNILNLEIYQRVTHKEM